MPYVGNKPVNNFVSFAKQNITGNGGTSYSLDYAVTGANDIELFINNVRQEPTEAYSASGATLTLTGAISSTDDVYVIFRGRALQTAQHPADSALEAASANIDSGTLYVDPVNSRVGIGTVAPDYALHLKGSFPYIGFEDTDNGATSQHTITGNSDGNVYFDSVINSSSGNSGFRFRQNGAAITSLAIDASGRVTTPYQPTFAVYKSTASSSGTYINYDSTWHNVGSHYSSGYFTAPVSGVYHFYATCLSSNSGGASRLQIRLNGSNRGGEARGPRDIQGISGDSYQFLHTSATIQCSANDSVGVYFVDDQNANQYGDGTPYNTFGGFLVG